VAVIALMIVVGIVSVILGVWCTALAMALGLVSQFLSIRHQRSRR
jgi:ABC-type Co2+ transport system permease subunit